MKIYAAADIHGAQFRVNEMIDAITANKPDITVICGDITQFGPGDMAYYILNQLPEPILVVPGNIDTEDVNQGIQRSKAINIQFQRYDLKGISFLGLNGVSERQTNAFYDYEDNKKLFSHLDVLVTHVPPYGFQDTIFLGKHGGSKALLTIINEIHPRLVLCGHIHENPGFMKKNDLTVINCSMGKRGKGAIVTIEKDDISVEMIS
jgi:uncharacterized protein